MVGLVCMYASQNLPLLQSTVLGETQIRLPAMVPVCGSMKVDPQGLQWVILHRESLLLVAHTPHEVNEVSRW